MEKLPHEILENILFRLPIEPALQARRVSKTWRNFLANRRFNGLLFAFRPANEEIQLYYGEHYDRIHVDKMNYYYSYEELIKLKHGSRGVDLSGNGMSNLVGSCNGLVCFRNTISGSFLVCNPLTGEVVVLPRNSSKAPGLLAAYGFGYCRSTENYKVVVVMYYSKEKVVHVQVCTIGNEWRNVVSIPQKLFILQSGIFVNGALNWLDYNDILECKTLSSNIECKTLSFDLEDEKLRLLPGPPSEARLCDSYNVLRLMGANLCFVQTDRVDGHLNIWAYKKNDTNINGTPSYDMEGHDMKSDYYNKNLWNWIKEFSIEVGEYCMDPFAITRSNEVLLWRKEVLSQPIRSIMYCYDPTTSTLNKLWDDDGMDCSQAVVIPHKNSLILLKDLVENASEDYKYYKTWELFNKDT